MRSKAENETGGGATLLTPSEVATLLRVSPVTVRQWSRNDELEFLVTPGGHRRYTLAAVRRFAAQRGMVLDEAETYRSGKLCVLVVEDDEQLRDYLLELFSTRPGVGRVVTAMSAFEAGRQVAQESPDLVLLDLMLPGVSGEHICRELKRNPETAHIRVVAMTGYYTQSNVERMLSAGAEACLAKPLETRLLLKACGLTE